MPQFITQTVNNYLKISNSVYSLIPPRMGCKGIYLLNGKIQVQQSTWR